MQHYDTKTLAGQIGVEQKTLENWRSLGKGPTFIKLGGRVVYAVADVDAWLARQRRSSTAVTASSQTKCASDGSDPWQALSPEIAKAFRDLVASGHSDQVAARLLQVDVGAARRLLGANPA